MIKLLPVIKIREVRANPRNIIDATSQMLMSLVITDI